MMQFTKRGGILLGIAVVMGLFVILRGEEEAPPVRYESPEVLAGRLADSDETVAWQAATDLGRLGSPVALDPLSRCMRSETRPRVRAAAARSLAKIGTWDAVAVLVEGMNDEALVVRQASDTAVVSMIGRDWQFDPTWEAEERGPWLEQFAEHVDSERGGWESWQKRKDTPYAPSTD